MIPRFLHFRHIATSTHELRLCHRDMEMQPGPDSILGQASEKVGGLVSDTINLRWVSSGVDLLKNVSSTWITNVKEAWMRDANTELVKDGQLKNIAEFARLMPATILRLIEERFAAGEKPTLRQLVVLLDHEQWVNFFGDPENFKLTGIPYDPAGVNLSEGPKGLFKGLDELARSRLYFEYVNLLVPQAVLNSNDPVMQSMFGPAVSIGPDGSLQETGVDQRAKIMRSNAATINQSFRYMLGIEKPPLPEDQPRSVAFGIAQQSLMHHYWRGGVRNIPMPDGTEYKLPFDTISPGLDPSQPVSVMANGLDGRFKQEMQRMMEGRLLPGRIDDIASRLNPSLLKGALDPAFGVVEPGDIGSLQKMMADETADETAHQQNTIRSSREYTGVDRRERQRNAETIGQTFMNLNGFEKIALVAIAFQVLRSKTMRNLAGGLGLLYFGQKFLLKQQDPINEVWMPMIRGLTKKVSDATREPLRGFGITFDHQKYTTEDITRRSLLMEQFLSERTRDRMTTAATGFTLLGDMSLQQIANNFVITKDGSLATLKYYDPNFQADLKEKIRTHGLHSGKALEFFLGSNPGESADENTWMHPLSYFAPNNPQAAVELGTDKLNRHLLDVGNGLGSVFYMIAIRNPLRKREQQIIEHFRGFMNYGSYDNLPYGSFSVDADHDGRYEDINPRELYAQLVHEGVLIAQGKGIDGFASPIDGTTTLSDFVASEMRVDTDPVHIRTRRPVPTEGTTDDPKPTEGDTDSTKPTEGTDDGTRTPEGTDDGTRTPEGTDDGTRTPDGADDGTRAPDGTDDGTRTPDGTDDGTRTPDGTDDGARTPDGTDDSRGTPDGTDDPTRGPAGPDDPARPPESTDDGSPRSDGTDDERRSPSPTPDGTPRSDGDTSERPSPESSPDPTARPSPTPDGTPRSDGDTAEAETPESSDAPAPSPSTPDDTMPGSGEDSEERKPEGIEV